MPGWLAISLAVVTAVIVTVVVAFGHRLARPDEEGRSTGIVRATFWVASVWAVVSIVGAVVVAGSALFQDDIRITVPIRDFWPRLPEGTEITGPTASIDGGGFTSADVIARGLSTGTRVMWAMSQAIAWLLPGIIAALLAVACWQLMKGRAFRPVVIRMAMVTAAVIAIGGVAAHVLGDIAGYRAGVELLEVSGAQYHDIAQLPGSDLSTWLPRPRFEVTLPFWPIAAGLAFAALAAILRSGARLARDTEGLV